MDNVVDAMGPFAGNANDPSITESILQLNDSLQRWTEYGDILLVNRGFRDCIESLEEAGFEVRMPAFLPAKQRQLPTADANASPIATDLFQNPSVQSIDTAGLVYEVNNGGSACNPTSN
ncbi:unnamed protein product [Rotaria sp. Silwood2]|nr:unnamed protein product [Rotaria sp. Silwood2]